MNNQKLTELAAKAVGIVGTWHHSGFVVYSGWSRGTFDPLNDDGDALRLAAELDMSLTFSLAGFSQACSHDGMFDVDYCGDRCSSMRRAITRAAAQICEEME